MVILQSIQRCSKELPPWCKVSQTLATSRWFPRRTRSGAWVTRLPTTPGGSVTPLFLSFPQPFWAVLLIIRMRCVTVCGLRSVWKYGHLLNDLMLLVLDVISANDTMISDTHDLAPIFDKYEIYSSISQLRMGCRVSVLFSKRSGYWRLLNIPEPEG